MPVFFFPVDFDHDQMFANRKIITHALHDIVLKMYIVQLFHCLRGTAQLSHTRPRDIVLDHVCWYNMMVVVVECLTM